MHKNRFTSGRWKDAFAFSRRERRGIAALLLLLTLECVLLYLMHYTPLLQSPASDFRRFQEAADTFYAALEREKRETGKATHPPSRPDTPATFAPFTFDPNTLDSAGWRKLGLSERTIRTLLRYRSKGGRFKTKEDLKKIYGLTEEQYAVIKPFAVIPAVASPDPFEKRNAKFYARTSPSEGGKGRPWPAEQKIVALVDIGIADTVELLRIRGVGYTFARRIHTYRERLGGFCRVAQLREVYGMNDSLYEAILPQICISDTTNLRKIAINSAPYPTLRHHPYIGGQLAGVVVNYRQQHGPFQRPEDLQKIPLVTVELCRKLAPYLSME